MDEYAFSKLLTFAGNQSASREIGAAANAQLNVFDIAIRPWARPQIA